MLLATGATGLRLAGAASARRSGKGTKTAQPALPVSEGSGSELTRAAALGALSAVPYEVHPGVQALPLEKGPISSFSGRLTGICILEIDLEYLLCTFHASDRG